MERSLIGGQPLFCLDTSVYIQAYRNYYPFDLAPGFWEALKRAAQEGKICSPITVYDEITEGSQDPLAEWAKTLKDVLFQNPDERVVEEYQKIVNFVGEQYHDEHYIREFLSKADPWVVAHALAHGLTVVTMESLKNEQRNPHSGQIVGKIKIPNVCRHFKVSWTNTFDLLRQLGVQLR